MHSSNLFREFRSGDTLCIECANKRIRGYFPWQGWGVPAWRTSKDYQHWCVHCRRPFIGALAREYCSDQCGELTRASRRDRTAERLPRPCAVCGDTFTPPRSDGRYCTPACRQKAWRHRRNR
jgi:hypothetical protein